MAYAVNNKMEPDFISENWKHKENAWHLLKEGMEKATKDLQPTVLVLFRCKLELYFEPREFSSINLN